MPHTTQHVSDVWRQCWLVVDTNWTSSSAHECESLSLQVFDPLVDWAQDTCGWHLAVSDSILGTNQPADTIAAVQKYLESEWH